MRTEDNSCWTPLSASQAKSRRSELDEMKKQDRYELVANEQDSRGMILDEGSEWQLKMVKMVMVMGEGVVVRRTRASQTRGRGHVTSNRTTPHPDFNFLLFFSSQPQLAFALPRLVLNNAPSGRPEKSNEPAETFRSSARLKF